MKEPKNMKPSLLLQFKEMRKQGFKIRGCKRKLLAGSLHREIYNQRSKIESIFSVIKRKYGYVVYARKFKAQKNELLFRIIAYNIEQVENNFVFIIYFTRSRF